MKKVEAAKWEAQRPADRSEVAHAERMAVLDRDRYTLAKTVNDLELAAQREEVTRDQLIQKLSATQQRLEELASGANSLSEEKVRSMVFKEIGVSWALEELDEMTDINEWRHRSIKCRILSRNSNDVFPLEFQPNSNSFEDAHHIWSCLGQ